MDTLQYQIEELRRAKLKSGEEEEFDSAQGDAPNAEKFPVGRCGRGRLCPERRRQRRRSASAPCGAPDALGGVRRFDDAGQLYERPGEAYSEVYDIAATVEDKRGELVCRPVS